MTYEDMNMRTTAGQFAVAQRVFQTMTINQHPTTGRFTVRNDRDGSIAGTGFASVCEAVRILKGEDDRRIGAFDRGL